MIKTLFLIAAVALATPAFAECKDLAQSRIEAQKLADKMGAGYVSLDGKEAQDLLDIVNKTGEPTSYKSDHIGILMMPSKGAAIVALNDNSCGGYGKGIVMPLSFVMQAYSKVRGEGKPRI